MRLLPQSLKGQLIALMLVALLASQAAGFLVILNDRKSLLDTEWFHNVVIRTATLADILDATPPEFHQKIMRTASVGSVRWSIDAAPMAPQQGSAEKSAQLLAEMRNVFGDKANDFRVVTYPEPDEASRIELLVGGLYHEIKSGLFSKASSAPKPFKRPVIAQISIPLKHGQWLNISIVPRGIGPPASPLLVQLVTMAILSAAGIIAIINRVTRPMKELARAASALGRGETSVKLAEKGPAEVVETVRAFNEMQDRLGRFVHDRTKMLAALGHDLRTPITSLRLRVEFIEDDEIRLKIIETLDEMLQMAETTLSFAREEAVHEAPRLVDAGALTSTVCADLADMGRNVICEDMGGFTLRCRPVALKRALRNVVENAVAYGKCARVSLELINGELAIHVDDDGPGIAATDMEKVFMPFVRLESSRNRGTGGVGLGLAIARGVIRWHGGDIVLRNRPEGGLRATLSLPGASPPLRPATPQDRKVAA